MSLCLCRILASYRALRNSDYAILLLIASTLLTTSMKPLSRTSGISFMT